MNRIATDVEQLAGFAFLETVEFNRLHHLLPEVFTVRFRHFQPSSHCRDTYSLCLNSTGYSYIYSLERIAKDSPKDHWTVMEVLTAYVRNKSPLPKGWLETPVEKRKSLPAVTTDVQSALTVIGRREAKNDLMFKRLVLGQSNFGYVK